MSAHPFGRPPPGHREGRRPAIVRLAAFVALAALVAVGAIVLGLDFGQLGGAR